MPGKNMGQGPGAWWAALVLALLALPCLAGASAQEGDSGWALVTAGVAGRPSNGHSFAPLLSKDGSTLAFASSASNLHADALPGHHGVYVFDLETSDLTLAFSRPASGGGDELQADLYPVGISADGSRVLIHDGREENGEDEPDDFVWDKGRLIPLPTEWSDCWFLPSFPDDLSAIAASCENEFTEDDERVFELRGGEYVVGNTWNWEQVFPPQECLQEQCYQGWHSMLALSPDGSQVLVQQTRDASLLLLDWQTLKYQTLVQDERTLLDFEYLEALFPGSAPQFLANGRILATGLYEHEDDRVECRSLIVGRGSVSELLPLRTTDAECLIKLGSDGLGQTMLLATLPEQRSGEDFHLYTYPGIMDLYADTVCRQSPWPHDAGFCTWGASMANGVVAVATSRSGLAEQTSHGTLNIFVRSFPGAPVTAWTTTTPSTKTTGPETAWPDQGPFPGRSHQGGVPEASDPTTGIPSTWTPGPAISLLVLAILCLAIRRRL